MSQDSQPTAREHPSADVAVSSVCGKKLRPTMLPTSALNSVKNWPLQHYVVKTANDRAQF